MRDPGLQAERTALAWQRSGVSGAALAGAATVAAAHVEVLWVLGAVAALSVLCGAAVAVAVQSARSAEPAEEGRRASPWLRLVAVAAIPVAMGVAGTLLAASAAAPLQP